MSNTVALAEVDGVGNISYPDTISHRTGLDQGDATKSILHGLSQSETPCIEWM